MSCEDIRPLLGAYHDGEILDVVRITEIDAHLAGCPACAREWNRLQAVSAAIRTEAKTFPIPSDLESKLRAKFGVNETEDAPAIGASSSRSWLSVSILATAACVAALLGGIYWLRGSATDRLEAEFISGHYRSLQASHLVDVPSSSQHTVKPWFQGKLDFSPNVPDLSSQGFTLVGGRLEYEAGQPAAALVYLRGKHVINVFVVHSTGYAPKGIETRDGYHLIKWSTAGLDYWAVSDVNASALEEFASDFQMSSGPSR